jgi:hypothetical protein
MPPDQSGLVLQANGSLASHDGVVNAHAVIDASLITVSHLSPHVIEYTLPRGSVVGVKVIYSSHCWTRSYDDQIHAGQVRIIDGTRPRAYCPARHQASFRLRSLLENLPHNRLYITLAERNYAVYNATAVLPDGTAYTAFFTLSRDNGKLDKTKHKLRMRVESAYQLAQPAPGQKIGLAYALSTALNGEKPKVRR